jgi:hypothetical protein
LKEKVRLSTTFPETIGDASLRELRRLERNMFRAMNCSQLYWMSCMSRTRLLVGGRGSHFTPWRRRKLT